MGHILRYALVLLIADGTMVNFREFPRAIATVAESFESYGIVPDVVSVAPPALACVTYQGCVEVNEGNILTPTQVENAPTVTWEANPDQFYTLAVIDPDVPCRAYPVFSEWNHWLIVNIKGNNVDSGETLHPYLSPSPLSGTYFHRYVFLVYKQPQQTKFNVSITSFNYGKFSIAKFAKKYNLGDPMYGNFFLSSFEDSVPCTQLCHKTDRYRTQSSYKVRWSNGNANIDTAHGHNFSDLWDQSVRECRLLETRVCELFCAKNEAAKKIYYNCPVDDFKFNIEVRDMLYITD